MSWQLSPTGLWRRLHQPSRWQDSTQVKTWSQHGVGPAHQCLRAAARKTNRKRSSWKQSETSEGLRHLSHHFSSYQTDLTTLMKLRPAGLAMTCDEVVPVVMDVPMVGRGMVMTGSGWLRASCCGAKGARRAGCDWLWTMGGSEGVGVTERGAERESAGWGVEHGVLVGVGVDGFGVPDPEMKEIVDASVRQN